MMKKVVLITTILLVALLILTTRAWNEKEEEEWLKKTCVYILGQRIVVLRVLEDEEPLRNSFEFRGILDGELLFTLRLRSIVRPTGGTVILGNPPYYWGCPVEGGAINMLFNALEVTYLAGIALWPLLLIVFLWVVQDADPEKTIVGVGLAAFFLYTLFGCIFWLGQLVDIARLLIWPVLHQHREWWWAFRIIGHTSPWSVGSWEIGATIVGALLLVACAGLLWWAIRGDRR